MKMDFLFNDCCYNNVEEISQIQNNIYQLADSFSYVGEAVTQENECQPLNGESDFIEFWKKNYQNYYKYNERAITNTMNQQRSCFTNNDGKTNDHNELKEILNHVPRLPSYLQRIGGKKINFIMIATTSDQKTILEDIEKTLDHTEFQALPLSFGQVQSIEHNFEDKTKQNLQQLEEKNNLQKLKRKPCEEEEQQWNEKEIMRSKSKKSRMSWMTKTTDLDEEDKELEQQIKMLIQTKQL